MKKFYAYADNSFNYHTMPSRPCFHTFATVYGVIHNHEMWNYFHTFVYFNLQKPPQA
jgi:hypothetical protein